jgi:hypothetical protein
LREGFRELNRMLIDSQQWDARHAQRQADNEFKHAQLQSNLQQQDFNNRMTTARLELANRGETRAAEKMRIDLANYNKDYKLRKADQTLRHNADNRAATTAKQATEIFNRNKGLWEEQDEENNLRMRQLQSEVELAEQKTRTERVNFNKFMSPDQLANPQLMQQLRTLFAKDGIRINPDGTTPNDMKVYDIDDVVAQTEAISEQYEDTHTKVNQSINQLTEQYATLKAQAKGSDNYNLRERGLAKAQMNKIKPQIQEHKRFFSTEGQLEFNESKATNFLQKAAYLKAIGQTELATTYEKSAKRHQDIVLAMANEIGDQQTAREKAARKAAEENGIESKDLSYHELWGTEGDPEFIRMGVFNKREGKWDTADGSLPPGVRPSKPTEMLKDTGDKGPSLSAKITASKDMLNVEKYFEQEGVMNLIKPTAARPMIRKLQVAINQAFSDMGKPYEDAGALRDEVLNKVGQWQMTFHKRTEQLQHMRDKDMKAVYNDLVDKKRIKPNKNKTKRRQIQDLYWNDWATEWRLLTNNPKFIPPRPNDTTLEIWAGETAAAWRRGFKQGER